MRRVCRVGIEGREGGGGEGIGIAFSGEVLGGARP